MLVFLILMVDQASKIYIKTHFQYGEEVAIFGLNWAYLHFVENNGMAFGISLGGEYGKLILSIFRIIAVILLGIYIKRLDKEGAHNGLILAFALIFAGALGNIIDCAFYGMIFSNSNYHGGLATMFPPEGGYAPFLHGKVVDMLYFPMVDTILPEWVPFWGGQRFTFFDPVFNVADAAISVGIATLIIFYNRFFKETQAKETHADKEESRVEPS